MARVLIVDDAPVNRRLLKTMLEAEGYEVVGEAEDGEEGVKLFIENDPDVVILDLSMPGMHGIDALKLMKEHDPKSKVIILSADSQHEKGPEAALHGADEYVTKPYKKVDILDAISRCLQN